MGRALVGSGPILVSELQKGSDLASANEIIAEEAAAQEDQYRSIAQIKVDLLAQLQGINRSIFGTPSEKKAEIERLVGVLESQNPTPEPTMCLEKVSGAWKLVYNTITILGSKRTKLGLRDFISLGDFIQSINIDGVSFLTAFNLASCSTFLCAVDTLL